MPQADERFSLRIRNLPAVLSTEAITSLLSHYGAIRVRVLQRRNAVSSGKEPGATTSKKLQKAIAIFATREAQENAQKRLHSLELAGHYLQVEVVGDEVATTSIEAKPEVEGAGNNVSLSDQPPLPKGLPPPLPPPAPLQNSLYTPAPLAPHLGLNYTPSPLLEYKYPKATESIVRNIANALIALPRFYTQVLHLMNKMNLPPPFEEDAIPGRFSIMQEGTLQVHDSDPRRNHRKRRRTDENPNAQIIEEEDDELDIDDGNATESNTQAGTVHPPSEAKQRNDITSNMTVLNKADQRPSIQRKVDPVLVLIGKSLARQNGLSSIKHNSTLKTAFQRGTGVKKHQEVHRSSRPGVISENEVNQQRATPEELQKESLMQSYNRGLPSSSIMAANIADGVDTKDLRYVFGYVLPMDMDLNLLQITLLPAKRSALITYPNEEVATAAVNQLHGVQLEGKTLIVSFLDPTDELSDTSETIPTVALWTLHELEDKRLSETHLASEKVMKRYQRGEPSNTLYVKNLARTVELADLFAVFGAVLSPEFGLEALQIRHFTVGRMKCQAFVSYPTVELASSALRHVHGVLLKDKPLVVCFRKPQSD